MIIFDEVGIMESDNKEYGIGNVIGRYAADEVKNSA